MTPRKSTRIAVLFVAGAAASPGAVAWAYPAVPCHVVESLDRAALSTTWRAAVDAFEREVAVASPGVCHGVELTLTKDPGGVRVSARALDGREASRLVADPVGLSAVAFGLLASAPGEPAPVFTSPFDPLEVPPPSEPAPPRALAPTGFDLPGRVSVSASVGARVALPTNVLMADLEIRVDVLIHDWLITAGWRAAPVTLFTRGAYDDDAYDETAFSLGVGRELRAGRSAFGLTAGPSLTYIWMDNDVLNVSVERAQLRLAGVGRWSYSVSPGFRLNTTLDAEVAPSGILSTAHDPGLAPFPAISAGLRLGAEMAL